MNFNLNGNMTVVNGQFGDTNTMWINNSKNEHILEEQDWTELQNFISMRIGQLSKEEESYLIAKESLQYIEKKDEIGLKGFLKRNRESFMNNVLSNVASSGLIFLLSKLNF